MERLIAAAELAPQDVVIEVGAGMGTLTRRLAATAGYVLAVELDDRLAAILQTDLALLGNVQVIHGDILRLSPAELITLVPSFPAPHVPYKVIGNLPFYITSAVLRHFLEAEPRPTRLVVTVQREVADRILAGPGEMSLLAVSVQFYGQPQLVARVPAGAFYPPPEVDSAIIRIETRGDVPPVPVEDVNRFFEVVRAGFGKRRKTLRNALSGGLGRSVSEIEAALNQAGVNSRRRAETLSLAEWAAITAALY